ncbi:MAG: glutaredoxin domain-containing protein [Pseudomonadota bacterium]
MRYLFTKDGCGKCEWVKNHVDLSGVDSFQEIHLDADDAESLAMLAYYECVTLAEKKMPILIDDSGEIITGAIRIRNHLKELSN